MNNFDVDSILKEVKSDFDAGYETCFGEPQSFVDAPNGRSLEITLESYGLPHNKYYYSCRVNCSGEEFDNDAFHSNCGVIDTFCAPFSDDGLRDIIKSGIYCAEHI